MMIGVAALILAAVIVVAGVTQRVIAGRGLTQEVGKTATPIVSLAKVTQSNAPEPFVLPGTIQPYNRALIYAQVRKDFSAFIDPGEEAERFKRIDSLWEQYTHLHDAMISASADIMKSKATNLLNSQMAAPFTELSDLLDKNVDYSRSRGLVAVDRGNVVCVSTNRFARLVLGIAVAATLIVGLWLFRSISGPLVIMTVAMRRLAGGDFVERSWRCTAHGGRYLAVGFADDDANGMTGRPLRMACIGNIDIVAVMVAWADSVDPGMRRFGFNPFGRDVADDIHADLLRLAAAGAIRPAVGRRVSMEEAGRALDEHEARRSVGRTVVEVA